MRRPPLSDIHRHRRRAEQAYRTHVKRGLRELYVQAQRSLSSAQRQLFDMQERMNAAHAEIPEEIVPPGPLHLRVGVIVHALARAGELVAAQEQALRSATGINQRIKL